MPIVDIHLIEGVFDKNQKQEMIRKVTDAMVDIEGEAMRGVTWVRLYEVASGEWGIGGKGITTADVKAMQNSAHAIAEAEPSRNDPCIVSGIARGVSIYSGPG